jgi:hypothetical protein
MTLKKYDIRCHKYLDMIQWCRRVIQHKLDSLVFSPSKGMKSSINNQSTSSENFKRIMAIPVIKVTIKVKVKSKFFTVKAPAFTISSINWKTGRSLAVNSVFHGPTEGRQLFLLKTKRRVQMMPWVDFVQGQSDNFISWPLKKKMKKFKKRAKKGRKKTKRRV